MIHVFWKESPSKHYYMYSLKLPCSGDVYFEERYAKFTYYLVLLKDGSFKDFNSKWAEP